MTYEYENRADEVEQTEAARGYEEELKETPEDLYDVIGRHLEDRFVNPDHEEAAELKGEIVRDVISYLYNCAYDLMEGDEESAESFKSDIALLADRHDVTLEEDDDPFRYGKAVLEFKEPKWSSNSGQNLIQRIRDRFEGRMVFSVRDHNIVSLFVNAEDCAWLEAKGIEFYLES